MVVVDVVVEFGVYLDELFVDVSVLDVKLVC